MQSGRLSESLQVAQHRDGALKLEAFHEAGFRVVITCSDDSWANTIRVGRKIDKSFIADVSNLSDCDVCGENGEYHSFVFDGPIFSQPVKCWLGETRSSSGFTQIDLRSQVGVLRRARTSCYENVFPFMIWL
jgi:diphthamide synthase (EF-2-diphthine--ammonia ligase)